MNNAAAKELKKNCTVMDATLKKFNLQVLSFSFRPYSDDDDDCTLIIEFSTIDGDSIDDDVNIKVNLYDGDGEIYDTEECHIYSEDFAGFDSRELLFNNNCRTLKEAKSARIFATRQ